MKNIDKSLDMDKNTVRLLLSVLWKDKYLISCIMITSIALGVFYLNKATYLHSVYLNVLPSNTKFIQPSSSSSGIVGIIGLAIGNNTKNNDFDLYKNLIISELSAKELLNNETTIFSIFEGELDPNTKNWIPPKPTFRSKTKDTIKKILGIRVYPPSPPNFERVFDYIKSTVLVSTNREKGITTIQILTSEPEKGALLIDTLHNITDNLLKERARFKAEENIKYLVNELDKTYQKDLRESLIKTLSAQQQNKMASSSDLPYAADKLGEINVSPKPVYPRAEAYC